MGRADWASALVVVVIWGLNFVVMKWGLATLSPLLLCALRFLAASLPLLLFVRPPPNVRWSLLAAYGLAQGMGQCGCKRKPRVCHGHRHPARCLPGPAIHHLKVQSVFAGKPL